MTLSLEIVSVNGQSLGASRRKVFGPEGGRIGRAPDCDWVIANPYVSRHHATVRWISGTYYIESTGENGVAINTPQAMIPQRERRALRNGDRIFIDEFEITVGIALADAAPSPQAASGGLMSFIPGDDPLGGHDPLGDTSATVQNRALPGADPLEPSNDDLDPLKHIGGGGGSRSAPAAPPAPSWNHTPGVSDHFTPPPVRGGSIPDDWDRTSFGRPGAGPTPVAPIPTPSRAPAAIPDDWDKTSFSRQGAPDEPGPAAAPAPVLRPRGGVLPLRPQTPGAGAPSPSAPTTPDITGQHPAIRPQAQPVGAQQPLDPSQPSGARRPFAVPQPGGVSSASTQTLGDPQPSGAFQQPISQPAGPQPPAARAPATAPVPGATGEMDLAALLRAAGIDPATVPPETAASLGLILRTVVQGVVEVLQARAEIKDQFRMALTRIKTAENNPLKFAVNAEDALNSLLGRRSPAYLAPVDAFEDAFDDIRFHQLAMLAGMRAGFDHAIQRFNPERLQEKFDKRGKRGGLLQMGAKSRYWEQYAEEFRELTADPEDAFKRLFGEVFAGAYEQQLEELKRSRRKPSR